MKYKKHIATGALAISLLVGGSSVFAATPQDLGIKSTHTIYQKSNKASGKVVSKKQNNAVGVVSALTSTGFSINVTKLKTKAVLSLDVRTSASTVYSQNGVKVTASALTAGQKVIVVGSLDKITNTLTAKTVKIVK